MRQTWCYADYQLYSSLEGLLGDRWRVEEEEKPDLDTLKAAMAATHPDRGGTSAAFIEARQRYVTARRQVRGDRLDVR